MSMAAKNVDVTVRYRVLHDSPGHVTYGVWVNGGKAGDLTVRQEERSSFELILNHRAGFEFISMPTETTT